MPAATARPRRACALLLATLAAAEAVAAPAAEEEATCPAEARGCAPGQAAAAGLLQRGAAVARAVVEAEPAAPRPAAHRRGAPPPPPAASLLRRMELRPDAPRNAPTHSKSENILWRAAEAGVALGQGKPAEELEAAMRYGFAGDTRTILKVLNGNAVRMTPEQAERNGLLVTVEDIATVTAVDGEDLSCVAVAGDVECHQGDMVPADGEQLRLFRMMAELGQGIRMPPGQNVGNLWTDAKVSYCYASDVSGEMMDLMALAMAQISSAVPCLEFTNTGNPGGWSSLASDVNKACGSAPAIFIQSKNAGCYSHVGMLGQDQLYANGLGAGLLNMQDPACFSIGTAVHELLHALGMGHEQARPDRDQYVQIKWDNVKRGSEHNFDVDSGGGAAAGSASSYDYLSIMQYSSHAFSSGAGGATVLDVGGRHGGEMGQRVGMSAGDAERLAKMYRAANSSCAASRATGEVGCLDTGRTHCGGLAACGGGASMEDCCACGAGVEYQCWSGFDCRQVAKLPVGPMDDHGACLADRSALFGGAKGAAAYGCVLQSRCPYEVQIRCDDRPGEFVNFPRASGYYVCALDQVCSNRSNCTFTKA